MSLKPLYIAPAIWNLSNQFLLLISLTLFAKSYSTSTPLHCLYEEQTFTPSLSFPFDFTELVCKVRCRKPCGVLGPKCSWRPFDKNMQNWTLPHCEHSIPLNFWQWYSTSNQFSRPLLPCVKRLQKVRHRHQELPKERHQGMWWIYM